MKPPLFDTRGERRSFSACHSPMPGNPARIGDGCAAVTGYKLPTATGSLFSLSPGQTRVSVSADNVTYYRLDPARAPTVDGLFPTDGSGDFAQPVNPALNHSSFAGQGLAGIRSLYAGSGGGAGYDLSWAVDDRGDSVALPGASYVRVEVLEGHSEIDAFSVVPEPAPGILAVVGTGVLWGLQRRKPGVPPRGSPVRPQDLAI